MHLPDFIDNDSLFGRRSMGKMDLCVKAKGITKSEVEGEGLES